MISAGQTVELDAALGKPIVVAKREMPLDVGQKTQVAIRPENFKIWAEGSDDGGLQPGSADTLNQLQGSVKEVVFLGDNIDYRIAAGERTIRLTAHPENLFAENTAVTITFDAKNACILEER